MSHLKYALMSVGIVVSVIGCGKGRESSNVIDRASLAGLELKNCDKGPCPDDPCATRQTPAEAQNQIGKLETFNDQVCKERPWHGYLLTEDVVKRSIEARLNTIPDGRRADFQSLLNGDLKKYSGLEFISDATCTVSKTRYFFPRLSIMDAWETKDGVTSQGGYSLSVGNDIEEACK